MIMFMSVVCKPCSTLYVIFFVHNLCYISGARSALQKTCTCVKCEIVTKAMWGQCWHVQQLCLQCALSIVFEVTNADKSTPSFVFSHPCCWYKMHRRQFSDISPVCIVSNSGKCNITCCFNACNIQPHRPCVVE